MMLAADFMWVFQTFYRGDAVRAGAQSPKGTCGRCCLFCDIFQVHKIEVCVCKFVWKIAQDLYTLAFEKELNPIYKCFFFF